MPIFWRPKERPPLRQTYQGLIKLRKEYPAMRNDRVIWLRNSDEANLVTLLRLDSKDEFVVVINFSNRPVTGWLEVLHDREFKPVKLTGLPELSTDGFPLFRLSGFDWRIYHRPVK